MSKSPTEYVRHMLDEAEYLLEESQHISRLEFLHDETLQRAFVRSIEILGEAANQLPGSFRERYPNVEWRRITAMRNRLIHGYFSVDYEIVWDVVRTKVPPLRDALRRVLNEEQ